MNYVASGCCIQSKRVKLRSAQGDDDCIEFVERRESDVDRTWMLALALGEKPKTGNWDLETGQSTGKAV